MSHRPALHVFDLELLTPRLGLTFLKKTIATVRRLVRDGVIASDEYQTQTGPIFGPGQPRKKHFLSLSGAIALASHARTPEAAAWRREQIAGHIPNPSNTLAVAPETSAAVLSGLITRVEQLEHRLAPVETRVEKLEARTPEQLQLPMACEVDHVALHATVIATLEKLITAVNGPNGARGLLAREIFDLIASGHVAALELREAIKAINGNRMPATAVVLGKVLQRVSATDGALEGQWSHNHVRRWVIAANGVH